MKNYYKRITGIFLSVFLVLSLISPVVNYAFAQGEDGFTESFETVSSINETVFTSPDGITEVITENAVNGNKSLKVAASGYYKHILKFDKKAFKADTQYTVKFSLKHVSGNTKYSFRLSDTNGKDLEYYEFWANNGGYCWGSVNTLQVNNKTLGNGAIEMTFTFTPNAASYFEIWSCEGITEAIFDDIIITPNEFNEPDIEKKKFTENFETTEKLEDTVFTSPDGTVKVTGENKIAGTKSLNVTASGYYKHLLKLEKKTFKADTQYTVKFLLKHVSGNTKYSFRLSDTSGKDLEYYEFRANNGDYCWSSVNNLQVGNKSLGNRIVEMTFTFTPKTAAYFEIWSCEGNTEAIFDDIIITPDEFNEPDIEKKEFTENFETAEKLEDTAFISPHGTAVIAEENKIAGTKSLNVTASGYYKHLLKLEKKTFKADTQYTVKFLLKHVSGNTKYSFRLSDTSGKDLEYYEFRANNGDYCWSSVNNLQVGNKSLGNGIVEMTFTFTPKTAAYFEIWSCEGNTEAIFDDIIITPNEFNEADEDENVFAENFEVASTVENTAYVSPHGVALITEENKIAGAKSLNVTASGYYQHLLKLERKSFKANIQYTVKLSLKHISGNNKYAFMLAGIDDQQLEYYEFWANNGGYCWGTVNTLQVSSKSFSGGTVEMTFTFTPNTTSYFTIWSCEGDTEVIFDDITITPDDLNDVEPKLEGYVEHFEEIQSVDDTIFKTLGQAELTEESIVKITTDGYYQELFSLDSSRNLLKAGKDYKIKFKYKYESGETKWGFKITSEFGEEMEYYEFFADTGNWCFGGSERINVSYRNMNDGYIEITFTYTPDQNAYFCLWATYSASAFFDYIVISPDEMLTPSELEIPENSILIDFENVKNAAETDILTSSAPTAVVTEEDRISGNKSLMVAITRRYDALVETDSSKVMLKAGTKYTFTTKIKHCTGAKNIGIRFIKYNGEEMKGGYMEFDSTTGAKVFAPEECKIEYIGKALPNGIVQVKITYTPLENSMLMLWSSSESEDQTKIIFDDFTISPDDLSKVVVVEGSLWDEIDNESKKEWQQSYLMGKLFEDFEKAGKMSDTAFSSDAFRASIVRKNAINGTYSLGISAEKQNIIALDDSYLRLKNGINYNFSFYYRLTGENSDYSIRLVSSDGKLLEEFVISPNTLQTVKSANNIKIKGGQLNNGVGYLEFLLSPQSDCIVALYSEKANLIMDDVIVKPTAPETDNITDVEEGDVATDNLTEDSVTDTPAVDVGKGNAAELETENETVNQMASKPEISTVKYISDIEFGKSPVVLSIVLLIELIILGGVCGVTVALIRKNRQ